RSISCYRTAKMRSDLSGFVPAAGFDWEGIKSPRPIWTTASCADRRPPGALRGPFALQHPFQSSVVI
ncbi:MAG: hypothetical protein AAGJ28_17405, partial [Pseudomonadota bacterium]